MEDSVDKSGSSDELLDTLIQYYENSEESTDDSRKLSERDRDYVDHKQFTAEEIATLRRRNQPPIVVNRIKPKVDFLLGMERQTRTDPKAFPRTPVHEDAAEAATDSIRYVLDNNEFDYTRSDVFENMLVEGTGGAEVIVNVGKKGPEIVINQYPWDRLFWDPHSRRRDFSDAKYLGAVVWMDYEDARELGNTEAIDAALAESSDSDTYDDTPRIRWIDKSRKRIKLCSIWWKSRQGWKWAMFTHGGFVKDPTISPFIDEDGEPECGLILQSAFVDRDGNRYGVVRGLIDIQDEINKRRSKALHLLTMRQTLSEQGAVDVEKAKAELAKPDGHIQVEPGLRFEVLNTNDLAQGQLALLQEAKGEIDAIGANAALQGKEERAMSGRALMARQQSGSMELGPVFDSLRSWQKRVYRGVWNRIRQYWTEEKWIRVTDDEDNLKWVGLNRPITLGERLEQELGPVPPEMVGDPRLDQVFGMENAVAELDVDIILNDAPDTVTLQTEQFDMLVQMYQANPQRPDNPEGVPWKMVVEASQLRNKDKVLGKDEDEEEDPEKAALMQKMQQMEQLLQQAAQEVEASKMEIEASRMEVQVKQAEQQAEIQLKELALQEAAIKRETTMVKSQADLDKVRIEAESARIEAESRREEMIHTDMVQRQEESRRAGIEQSIEALRRSIAEIQAQQMAAMMEEPEPDEVKTITIKTPSGQVYSGMLDNGSVEVRTPSGQIYTGTVNEV